jgi:hypothetical protein
MYGFFSHPKMTPYITFNADIWRKIHVKAKAATDKKSQYKFRKYIKHLIKYGSCKECTDELGKYYQRLHPDNYKKMRDNCGNKVGYFYWSWELHNHVNRKLGKPVHEYRHAYTHYYFNRIF